MLFRYSVPFTPIISPGEALVFWQMHLVCILTWR